MKTLLTNERGMTLLEMLAVITIGVIVIGAATFFFSGLQSLWTNTNDQYVLDSEKKQIMNLLNHRLADASQITVGRNHIAFLVDDKIYRLQLIPGTDGQPGELQYIDGNPASDGVIWSLSQSVASLLVEVDAGGPYTELADISAPIQFTSQHIVRLDFRLVHRSASEAFSHQLKPLYANIAGQGNSGD